MRLKDFSYELPNSLIAQRPLSNRTASRLMVVDKLSGTREHTEFRNFPDHLREGDLLIINRSRVVPARLFVRRKSGGQVEVLFVRKEDSGSFRALLKAAGRIRVGEELSGEGAAYSFRVLGRPNPRETIMEVLSSLTLEEIMEKYGHVPLPPYIARPDEPGDRSRYQTVYARERGSVAAPTAGLHFDEATLETLRCRGVGVLSVVLHVGPGTFLPLANEEVGNNQLLSEVFCVDGRTLEEISAAKNSGGRVIAVGTTVTRVLEASFQLGLFGSLPPGKKYEGKTDLFIYPGFEFNVIDALLTNFHLPGSSLLLLVCALLNRENTLACYREAVEKKYRFYSYGDAMFIR